MQPVAVPLNAHTSIVQVTDIPWGMGFVPEGDSMHPCKYSTTPINYSSVVQSDCSSFSRVA